MLFCCRGFCVEWRGLVGEGDGGRDGREAEDETEWRTERIDGGVEKETYRWQSESDGVLKTQAVAFGALHCCVFGALHCRVFGAVPRHFSVPYLPLLLPRLHCRLHRDTTGFETLQASSRLVLTYRAGHRRRRADPLARRRRQVGARRQTGGRQAPRRPACRAYPCGRGEQDAGAGL